MRGNLSKSRPSSAGTVAGAELENGSILAEKLADGAVTERKLADGTVTLKKLGIDVVSDIGNKLDKTQYASTEQAGVIKIYKRGDGTNISGIVVKEDGSAYVNTNSDYGTMRTGDGKVVIAAASEDDIDAKTNKYKPITPSTLDYAVKSVNVYTATPQKVGTWVDGTPVWRVVVERTITDSERSKGHIYFNEEDLHFSEYVGVATGAYINGYAYVTYSDGGVGEGVILTPFEPFTFTYGGEIPADYTKVIGWVEFVTPEENLTIT